ncbi:hypothetical protein THII_3548 [Thioploca ingrica]|uniref:Uncharacterized protein n=1 Tax=Thioploca ingrica TaxID=40754 RepID=A0A090AQF8_9GAMM|nr:hypothetical protein THII_3548 [Thioploca ingrica]
MIKQSIVIVILLIVGLFIDQKMAWWGQSLTNLIIWIVLLAFLRTVTPAMQVSLVLCLGYATAGEMFLSLVWGLYEYRLHNVPLFVPPGHALLFTLGLLSAQKIPGWIVWYVPLVFTPYMIFAVVTGVDTLGGILFVTFIICLVLGQARQLYATMFILSLLLEIYGTWLGNWTWSLEVPWLGLTSTNPPISAGTFYCLLDLLVVSTTSQIQTVWSKIMNSKRLATSSEGSLS